MSNDEIFVGDNDHGDSLPPPAVMAKQIVELRRERDEARRQVCEMFVNMGGIYRRVGGKNVEVTDPRDVARMKGWECYMTLGDGDSHSSTRLEGV